MMLLATEDIEKGMTVGNLEKPTSVVSVLFASLDHGKEATEFEHLQLSVVTNLP